MECNVDARLSIMDEGIENAPQEEVEGDQEVETQEPEQEPSTEALSNQIKPEEPKSLAWYLDKAMEENKEWATFDPKKCKQLKPKSNEPENSKRYIWKQDEKSNWYMEEVNEAEKKENKIIDKQIDTNGMVYQVLVNGSEIIEGPPIHSRKNLFGIFSKKNYPQDMEIKIKSAMNNGKYCKNSLEDLRNENIDCFKDEKFIKEWNREESNQTVELKICEISQDPPKKKIKHPHAYENLWEDYINHDSLKEIKPKLS
ncbi:hypothetical protein O181_000391 [Austropuccinia psidii MF-1]|uniref:Uncharacterized protein n=1 Tax=Austropuccinia psidii MF-1 TaxID=1389203 RepID=A0A9Q3GBJ8_9BASI|nr:hypothetical protein [Austropuccinia psidii MF-1]